MSTCRKIVNWRTHLKFPEEAKLSPEAKDLICKLLCNVEQRLGTKGAHEIKAHPWFKGIEWDKLYQMKAAFIPEVNDDELDTQNFEKFEETDNQVPTATKSGPWRKEQREVGGTMQTGSPPSGLEPSKLAEMEVPLTTIFNVPANRPPAVVMTRLEPSGIQAVRLHIPER
nr:serine/threonine-protein kinase tricorner-like [Ipomoea batatas]GME09210.1 serine/threonine-protein kinase tricorner-like [Ipomoea batatas]